MGDHESLLAAGYSPLGLDPSHADRLAHFRVILINDCTEYEVVPERSGRFYHSHIRCSHPHLRIERAITAIQNELRRGALLNDAEDAAQRALQCSRYNIVMGSSDLEDRACPRDPRFRSPQGYNLRIAHARNFKRTIPPKVHKAIAPLKVDTTLQRAIADKLADMRKQFGALGLNEDNAIRSLILQGAAADKAKRKQRKSK